MERSRSSHRSAGGDLIAGGVETALPTIGVWPKGSAGAADLPAAIADHRNMPRTDSLGNVTAAAYREFSFRYPDGGPAPAER